MIDWDWKGNKWGLQYWSMLKGFFNLGVDAQWHDGLLFITIGLGRWYFMIEYVGYKK